MKLLKMIKNLFLVAEKGKLMKKSILFFHLLCLLIKPCFSSAEDLYSDYQSVLDEEILQKIPLLESREILSITPLRGIINNNYKVKVNNPDSYYVVKLTNKDQDFFTNRFVEKRNQNNVSQNLKIAPSVEYVSEDQRIMVLEYIDPSKESIIDSENILLYAKSIAYLHKSFIKFENENSFLKQLNNLREKLLELGIYNDNDDDYFLRKLTELEKVIDIDKIEFSPCHNDLNLENFIFTSNDLKIIDWEFSGQNDPAWDVSYFLMSSRLREDLWSVFFENYFFIYTPDKNFIDRVMIYRPFVLLSLGMRLQFRLNEKKLKKDSMQLLIRECFLGAKSLFESTSYKNSIKNININ
tara:strand:- start:7737 stop:8795 length:1059 start_codon:yes stop_codon:yes gene_type:complete